MHAKPSENLPSLYDPSRQRQVPARHPSGSELTATAIATWTNAEHAEFSCSVFKVPCVVLAIPRFASVGFPRLSPLSGPPFGKPTIPSEILTTLYGLSEFYAGARGYGPSSVT